MRRRLFALLILLTLLGVDAVRAQQAGTHVYLPLVPRDRAPTLAPSTWDWSVRPAATSLRAISAPNGDVAWAAGGNGTILRTVDRGATWSDRSTGVGAYYGVGVASADAAWVVGEGGSLVSTVDGGQSWRRPATGTTRNLNAAAAGSARVGWAVGEEGTILHTTDGGATWRRLDAGTAASFGGVVAVGESDAWAVSPDGPVAITHDGGATWTLGRPLEGGRAIAASPSRRLFTVPPFAGPGRLQLSDDGGVTWSRRDPYLCCDLRGVAAPTDQRLWIVGGSGLLARSDDAGAGWAIHPGVTYRYVTAVAAPSPSLVWAVTENDEYGLRNDPADIVRSDDAGATWSRQGPTAPARERLLDVEAAPGGVGWAVGVGGLIMRTGDGGATWSRQSAGTSVLLRRIAIATPQVAWAVGDQGTILRTSDAGATWGSQPSGVGVGLSGVAAALANVAWVVGEGVILKTDDGGRSWVKQLSDARLVPDGVAALSTTTAWVVGYELGPAPPFNVGMIMKTEDGGATWTTQLRRNYGPLTDVSVVSPSVVWVSGDNGALLVTENGGQSWGERRAPGPWRDEDAIESRYDVVGLSAGGAWVVNSADGVYATADLGRTWTRVVHTRRISHVAAASETAGFAVGDTSRILVARPASS